MHFFPIKTRPLLPPQDNIFDVLDQHMTDVREWDIIFITSKVLAIHQGRCIHADQIVKKDLIEQEADKRITTDVVPGRDIYLTIKNNILIPSAGIDESNSNDYLIMRPEDLSQLSKEIHTYICKRFDLTDIGIVITDSTTRPLKRWVVGIGIYSYGFYPLRDERWAKDIFDRELKITQINIIDALSAMAVYLMGEGNECQPIVIGREIPGIQYTHDDVYPQIEIPPQQDLYYPLLKPLIE
jgi:F420-0:gamma-glutamyl ligase